jgi:O-antigen ligase
MVALLALVTVGVQTAAGTIRRSRGWLWLSIALLTLALTRSSAVLLAAAGVAGVLALALLARRLPASRRAAVSWGAAGALAATVLGGFVFAGPLLEFLRRNVDLTHRLDVWAIVTDLAAERPVAGWGWVSHWAPWVEPFDDLVVINGVTYLQAHNAWVDVHFQLGWIGLLVFAALVVTVLVRSWWLATDSPQVAPGRTEPFAATTLLPLLVITALLVQSLAESRMLVELGWTLLVVIAISTKRVQLPVARPTAERSSGVRR